MRALLRPVAVALSLSFAVVPAHARPQDDAKLRELWSELSPADKRTVTERFAAEAAELDTRQNQVLARALALGEADPQSYPKAEPVPYYEPELHAPDLAIPRVRLEPDGLQARETRRQMFAKYGVRRLRSAWRYDWGARRVVRIADPTDPEHVFANGLMGQPPGLDLAEALLERALDDGRHQKELAAFGHAYTDREGGVYPLTLYDAWCSGETMEMPDIDNLGIVHDLLDDWSSWTSPVPENRQKSLYRKVEQLFQAPRGYRALRTALARTYLTGVADMRDGLEGRIDHLHGLWHRNGDAPEQLVAALPGPADELFFLADWGLEVEEDQELRAEAARRHLDLQREAWQLRKLLIRVLDDVSASAEEH
jgi:hypothetical protein